MLIHFRTAQFSMSTVDGHRIFGIDNMALQLAITGHLAAVCMMYDNVTIVPPVQASWNNIGVWIFVFNYCIF